MSPAVADIEQRLNRVIRYPQPWVVVETDGHAEVRVRTKLTAAAVLAVAASLEVAEFIAHAPVDVYHLLRRVEDLEEQNAALRAGR